MPYCENAATSISLDSQLRSWEHFYIGNSYIFSNMIPNQESYTRTDPGWVLFDYKYCTWQGEPPSRDRQSLPAMPSQPLSSAQVPLSPVEASKPSSHSEGGLGILVLLAVAAAVGFHFLQGKKAKDPSYHPMADLDTTLPRLGLKGSREWKEGDPIPVGFKVVEVPDEEDTEESLEANEEPLKESWGEGYTEPNPWLKDSLKHLIHHEANKATTQRIKELEHIANVPELMRRIYPHSQGHRGGSTSPNDRGSGRFSNGSQGGSELVEQSSSGGSNGLSAQWAWVDDCPPTGEIMPLEDQRVSFEHLVERNLPLTISVTNPKTIEIVKEAIRLGYSQNWIITNLFQVGKGGSEAYRNAVNIVRTIRNG